MYKYLKYKKKYLQYGKGYGELLSKIEEHTPKIDSDNFITIIHTTTCDFNLKDCDVISYIISETNDKANFYRIHPPLIENQYILKKLDIYIENVTGWIPTFIELFKENNIEYDIHNDNSTKTLIITDLYKELLKIISDLIIINNYNNKTLTITKKIRKTIEFNNIEYKHFIAINFNDIEANIYIDSDNIINLSFEQNNEKIIGYSEIIFDIFESYINVYEGRTTSEICYAIYKYLPLIIANITRLKFYT